MILYWGIFTLGFWAGAILAFIIFAPKSPQDDPDYAEIQKRPSVAAKSRNRLQKV